MEDIFIYCESSDWTSLLKIWDCYDTLEEFYEEYEVEDFTQDEDWCVRTTDWYARFRIIVWKEAVIEPKKIVNSIKLSF